MDELAANAVALKNDQDLVEAVREVLADHLRLRHPHSTSRAYEAHQRAWRQWCQDRRFSDGVEVSESKLSLFLKKEFVHQRGVERKMALSREGVQNYVKAIVDLYKSQQSLSVNTHPHPRGKALKVFLYNDTLLTNKHKRDEYEDRGDGTVLETYGEDEMHKLSKYYFDDGSEKALRD
ncbi:Short-chain dehydrogenase [Globisporangium polare]